MTDPIAAARDRLIELILHYDGSDAFACADAILAAFPSIAASPQVAEPSRDAADAMTDPIAAARNALGLDRPPRKYHGLGNEAHARKANMQIGAARAALEGRVKHVAAAIIVAEARAREDAIKQMASFWGNATWHNVDRSEWDALIAAIRAGGGR